MGRGLQPKSSRRLGCAWGHIDLLWEARGWFSGEQQWPGGGVHPPLPFPRELLLGLASLLPLPKLALAVDPAHRSPEEQVSLLGLQVCGPTCSMPWVTP